MADGYSVPAMVGEIPAPTSLTGTIETTSPVLRVDSELTEGSVNAAQSGAVYRALQLKLDKSSSMGNDAIAGLFHN